ncbi:MAG TPA: radical SAM family heme chaperone HemW [Rhodothermales bacterium]|nr:radical SAM family heme chaperone HemW [Rhodothermales bacterium]
MAGLYVHVPFCAQRCTYCDFYFVAGEKATAGFVQAALVEIEALGQRYGAREPIGTIYFGGGTPSRLPVESVFALLDAVRRHFRAGALDEVTFELNPDDATPEYLRSLRALGIDRLSIGVQSFFDEDLRWMRRVHTADQADTVVAMAREAGFDNLSLDLIFGLPDQPEEYWAANLERAVRLGAEHLSTYGLTIEERTALGKAVASGRVVPADDETMAVRYRFTMDYLRAHGYEHYEISAFAKPGRRAVHNARYWTHANYLGVGPSAHSFWWDRRLGGAGARRWSNVRSLARYEALIGQGRAPLDEQQQLSLDTLANEFLMLRLRTSDGLDLDTLEGRYGVDLLAERVDEIAALEAAGLARLRGTTLRLTDEGKLVADAVTERLVLDETHRGL